MLNVFSLTKAIFHITVTMQRVYSCKALVESLHRVALHTEFTESA